jgi:hypothetical protein
MASSLCRPPPADAAGSFQIDRGQRELALDGKIHALYPASDFLWDANEAVRV